MATLAWRTQGWRPAGTIWNLKMKKQKIKNRVGFGRTEVSVRLDCIVFVLFHLGMVPGFLVLKCFGKVWIFMNCLCKLSRNKHENAKWKWSEFGLQISRPVQNHPPQIPKNPASSRPKQLTMRWETNSDSWGSRISPGVVGPDTNGWGPYLLCCGP